MKRPLVILGLVVGVVLFDSCEITVNEGSSSEETKGNNGELKNGFSYEDVELLINGIETVENNEITAGEFLFIRFNGLSNPTVKDGYIHVGVAIQIFDENGQLLDESEDLLGNVEQQDPDIDYVQAHFTVPDIEEHGEIRVKTTLFDKYGTVSYDFDEVYKIVKQAPPVTEGIVFKTNLENVSLEGQLFLGKKQFASTPAMLDQYDEVYFYLNNVNGFVEENSEVSIDYSMIISSADGEVIFELDDNIVGSTVGYDYYPLYFNAEVGDSDPGEYVWYIKVMDTRSDKYVETTADLVIK